MSRGVEIGVLAELLLQAAALTLELEQSFAPLKVLAFDVRLGAAEERGKTVERARARGAQLAQALGFACPESGRQDFVIQGHERAVATGIALPAATSD